MIRFPFATPPQSPEDITRPPATRPIARRPRPFAIDAPSQRPRSLSPRRPLDVAVQMPACASSAPPRRPHASALLPTVEDFVARTRTPAWRSSCPHDRAQAEPAPHAPHRVRVPAAPLMVQDAIKEWLRRCRCRCFVIREERNTCSWLQRGQFEGCRRRRSAIRRRRLASIRALPVRPHSTNSKTAENPPATTTAADRLLLPLAPQTPELVSPKALAHLASAVNLDIDTAATTRTQRQ